MHSNCAVRSSYHSSLSNVLLHIAAHTATHLIASGTCSNLVIFHRSRGKKVIFQWKSDERQSRLLSVVYESHTSHHTGLWCGTRVWSGAPTYLQTKLCFHTKVMFFHDITGLFLSIRHIRILFPSTFIWSSLWLKEKLAGGRYVLSQEFLTSYKDINKKLSCSWPALLNPSPKIQWWLLLLSEIFCFLAVTATMITRKSHSSDYELKF